MTWGGYWTEAKLDILTKYTRGFTVASKSANGTVYLDLFAGRLHNIRPDTGKPYLGSTGRAIETVPPFSKLVFWELEPTASELRAELLGAYPGDRRWTVVGGDCNAQVAEGLRQVDSWRWAPTLAFIDPKGLDVAWSTFEHLSKWRTGRSKVEMWILLPEPAIERVLGLRVQGLNTPRLASRLYGCDDWLAIHERRRRRLLTAEQARAEYVNLLRWRLERVLGYAITHPLALVNPTGSPVYTMIFATDHAAGSKIMSDVYESASVREIPELRAQALAHREAIKTEDSGHPTLFDVPPIVPAQPYAHVDPWEPLERISDDGADVEED